MKKTINIKNIRKGLCFFISLSVYNKYKIINKKYFYLINYNYIY